MSDTSAIEWTDATWNPVTGCTKVSQGCKHCYAEREWPRLSAPRPKPNAYTGRAFSDVQCHADRLDAPLRWKKPRRVFVNSMSDLFHEDVPDEFIDQVFAVMGACQFHTFQILTKRPKRMLEYFNETWQAAPIENQRAIYNEQKELAERMGISFPEFNPQICVDTRYDQIEYAFDRMEVPNAERFWTPEGKSLFMAAPWPLPNVWLGVSVEDQAAADERIPLLLQTPAAVRWISAEPLLGPVDLRCLHYDGMTNIDALAGSHGVTLPLKGKCDRLDWIVAGGESGRRARPSHPDWFRSLRDQCAAAGVPFFFKQWGEWLPGTHYTGELQGRDSDLAQSRYECAQLADPTATKAEWDIGYTLAVDTWDDEAMFRCGKRAAGRLLQGREHSEYPVV